MKTSNYLAKLPQEVTIKSIETHQGYDSFTLDVPKQKQRLCPHCGSVHCVIKDSGVLQTVRHIRLFAFFWVFYLFHWCFFLFHQLISEFAYGHFLRPAGPHFPDSLGHIKRTAQ